MTTLRMLAPRSSRPVMPAVIGSVLLLAAAFLPTPTALAGQPVAVDKTVTRGLGKEEPVPLNLFEVGSSYVGSSGFENDQFGGSSGRPSRSYGEQDEEHYYVSYAHRIPLGGKLFLKLGASYDRFDFGTTFAPLPTSLQAATGIIGLEYIVQGRPAIFIESKPGVFFSDTGNIGTGNFDAPTVVAVTFPIFKGVYGIAGARASILGRYHVLPIGGLVWVIRDNFRLEAVPPEPRLIYSFSEKLDVFVGAELLGDTYKRDRNANARPQDRRYNEAVLDYSEVRIGAGVTLTPVKGFDIDITGGYVPKRTFDYYRGPGKRFVTDDGAPYAKIALKAEF